MWYGLLPLELEDKHMLHATASLQALLICDQLAQNPQALELWRQLYAPPVFDIGNANSRSYQLPEKIQEAQQQADSMRPMYEAQISNMPTERQTMARRQLEAMFPKDYVASVAASLLALHKIDPSCEPTYSSIFELVTEARAANPAPSPPVGEKAVPMHPPAQMTHGAPGSITAAQARQIQDAIQLMPNTITSLGGPREIDAFFQDVMALYAPKPSFFLSAAQYAPLLAQVFGQGDIDRFDDMDKQIQFAEKAQQAPPAADPNVQPTPLSFLGQRGMPDARILQQLAFPNIMDRVFAKGLDVFAQPVNDPLTDDNWQVQLDIHAAPSMPAWVHDFMTGPAKPSASEEKK
jgi:hypothetical protein